MLEIGQKAPDFTLPDDRGGTFRLSAHRGKPVVVEFYCEDGTEGCEIENREFSALAPEFSKLGVAVVGISPQDVESHRKFSASCPHQSFIGQPARSRSNNRQPATAIST